MEQKELIQSLVNVAPDEDDQTVIHHSNKVSQIENPPELKGFDDYLVQQNTYEDEEGTHVSSRDTLVNVVANINTKHQIIG